MQWGVTYEEAVMTFSLSPRLTIRIRPSADRAWRRLETHSRHFSIRCWTLYWLEVLVFRYIAR